MQGQAEPPPPHPEPPLEETPPEEEEEEEEEAEEEEEEDDGEGPEEELKVGGAIGCSWVSPPTPPCYGGVGPPLLTPLSPQVPPPQHPEEKGPEEPPPAPPFDAATQALIDGMGGSWGVWGGVPGRFEGLRGGQGLSGGVSCGGKGGSLGE